MHKPDILHIAQDEKFINAAYYLFERAFPGANTFVVVKAPANPPLRHIDKSLNMNIEVKSRDTVQHLLQRCRKSDLVVMHGISNIAASVFLESDEKDKFIGMIFGSELYRKEIAGNDFLGVKTGKLIQKLREKSWIDRIKSIYRNIKYRHTSNEYSDLEMKNILPKLRIIGTVFEDSLDKWVEQKILDPAHKFVPFCYYPLEFIIQDSQLRADGPDIMLGNSASATNNHLEALDLLKNFDLGDRKIITPLSYGNARYAGYIQSYGQTVLPQHFKPVTDFLPLEQYNRLIANCGVVIMNHYRSQAMGTIIAALYMGAKVFLNDTNIYRNFKKKGCHIFSIENDLLKQKENAFLLLNKKQIEQNRQVLEDRFSDNCLVEELRNSLWQFTNVRLSKY